MACGPRDELTLEQPTSSQEVSALLLALACAPGGGRLEVFGEVPSRPYVDLTRRVLADFGVRVDPTAAGYAVAGLPSRDLPYRVEADASLAAVVLGAAAVTAGEVETVGVTARSAQGDVRIVDHLRAFGCEAEFTPDGLGARGAATRRAELDLAGEPDLAPVLAAVGAASGQGCRLTGLETLPGKESSRIRVLAEGLRRAGWPVEDDERSLTVHAGAPGTGPVRLDPHGDHRMAFAFALLSLARPGIRVTDPGCVAKSWPGFWDALEGLGARPARD